MFETNNNTLCFKKIALKTVLKLYFTNLQIITSNKNTKQQLTKSFNANY